MAAWRLYKERPDKRDPYEMFRIAYPNIVELYGPQPELEPEDLPPLDQEGLSGDAPSKAESQAEADWKRIMSAFTSSQ